MSKRILFLIIIFGILFLLYKIAVTEYQSLRAQTRMVQYQQEIVVSEADIYTYKRRHARNDTVAHRVAQKKMTWTVKLPEEEVVVFSTRGERELDRIDVNEIFRVELDVDQSDFYSGLTVPKKWNKLILDY